MDYEVTQLNETTWCIFDGVARCFLLAGEEKALLVDTGMKLTGIRAKAEELSGKAVELINTHADPDHTGANGEFERYYMHPAEQPRSGSLPGERVPVTEGDVIELGGRTVTVVELPGHTPGSIGLLDADARVLISGDTVQTGSIVMLGPERSIEKLSESLQKLEEHWMDRFDTVWAAHGAFPLPASVIPALRESAAHVLAGDAKRERAEFFHHEVIRCSWGCGTFLVEE